MLIKDSILYKLAKECKKVGYKKIIVNMGAVSAYPNYISNDLPRTDRDWPAIWKIVEDLNISYGCGNSHQHQIKNVEQDIQNHLKYLEIYPELQKLNIYDSNCGLGLIINLEGKVPLINKKAYDILFINDVKLKEK